MEYESQCCLAPVETVSGEEGTNHFECTKCGKPCDVKVTIQQKELHGNSDNPNFSTKTGA